MKISLIAILFLLGSICYSQQPSNGKPYAEIFGDFHYKIMDTTQNTGFQINRAQLGYVYEPAGNISATIVVDIGTPDDLAPGAKSRRYGYFRDASLTWAKDKLEVTMGITGTRIFSYQQKFWGQRYLEAPVLSIYGLGYVADLGVTIDYRLNDIISADFTLMNGEGYTSVQLDDYLKTSVGITVTPTAKFVTRVYFDTQKKNDVVQNTFVGFAGYKSPALTVGAELSYRTDIDGVENHNGFVFSTTTLAGIAKNTELFFRYDYRKSEIMESSGLRWNQSNDGFMIITGLQYKLSDNVKLALNYRTSRAYKDLKGDSDMIFLNTVFRF